MPRLLFSNLFVWSCLFGAGVGAVQTVRSPPEAPVQETPVPPDNIKNVAWLSLDLPERDSFVEVTARPLFSATRRPPRQATVAEQPTELPPIMLTGVTGRPGALQAIVVHPEEGILRLVAGAGVAGWIISDISLTEIEIRPVGGGVDPVKIALGESALENGRRGSTPMSSVRSTAEAGDDAGGLFGGIGYD